jgi:hypothetical protein
MTTQKGECGMRRLNLLGVALVAMLALSAFVTTAAFAILPEHLPKGTWTGNNDGKGVPTLEASSGTKVECEKAKGSGADVTDTLGTFTIDFEGCKTPNFFNAKCNTTGDGAGIILSTGEYHFVYDTLSPLGIAVLFLANETTFECSSFLKTKVKGHLVCLILEPLVSMVTHLFHCEQEKGKQKETKYWNDEGKEVNKAELLCSLNGGAFEVCAELALGNTTYGAANFWEEP